jgi:hypothetical protein
MRLNSKLFKEEIKTKLRLICMLVAEASSMLWMEKPAAMWMAIRRPEGKGRSTGDLCTMCDEVRQTRLGFIFAFGVRKMEKRGAGVVLRYSV